MSDPERAAYLVLLEWFEHYRMRYDLEANRDGGGARTGGGALHLVDAVHPR